MKLLLKILLFISFVSNAQNSNLVPNYSFEDTLGCNQGYNYPNLQYWYNPNAALYSPDLANRCEGWDELSLLLHKRHQGFASVGFYTFSSTSNNVREFIAVKLKTKLVSNKKYCFDSYLIPALMGKRGTNNVGVYFGVGTQTVAVNIPPIIPQLQLPIVINDTANWYKFEMIYNSQGGESDILIGGFMDDVVALNPIMLDSIKIGNGYMQALDLSYLIIDDISLHEMSINSGNDAVTCSQNMVATIGELNTDTAFKSYWWYDASGALIDSINSQIQVQPITNTYYIQEKRMCGQSLWDTVFVKIDTICPPPPPEPPVLETEFIVPNVFSPNADEINEIWEVKLGNKELQSCVIYNRWGVEQKSIKAQINNSLKLITWDGFTTSGAASSDGVYYYVLEIKNERGELEKYRGYITLLR